MTVPGYIAGSKTAAGWQGLRHLLTSGAATDSDWSTAYTDYFLERLRLRYLNPIGILPDSGTFHGEGFAIAVIQCSLIEFLESTWQGTRYRYLRRGETSAAFEYNSSIRVFVSFLTERDPFARECTLGIAEDFYEGVRSGVLHEARTIE